MSKDVVINISDKSQWDKLPKTVEYIVLYTYFVDSTGASLIIDNKLK